MKAYKEEYIIYINQWNLNLCMVSPEE